MENKKKIYTTLKDGSKIEYDVIMTFKNEDNNKDYIVYTDNKLDENDKLRIYASIYDASSNKFIGVPETQEEWNKIYELLDKVLLDK